MHCLTSSIFLPSFLIHLTPPHRLVLLKSYLLVVLVTALARGRPRIDPEIILSHTAFPSSKQSSKSSEASSVGVKELDDKVDVVGKVGDATYGNFWTGIVDQALHAHGTSHREGETACLFQSADRPPWTLFTDSHVTKSIRSLLLYSRLYGHLPPGSLLGTYKGSGKTEETIPSISRLGGDLFSRAVGIIFEQTGWPDDRVKKGEADEEFWDMSALGYDEAWKEEEGGK